MIRVIAVIVVLICRVFGITLDDDDDDDNRGTDESAGDDGDTLAVDITADNSDNPTNLFSSATGLHIILHYVAL